MEEVRRTYHGVNGISTHYHILCDAYLGLGRYPIRRISRACIEFSDTMDLIWDPYIAPNDHPRYSSVTK